MHSRCFHEPDGFDSVKGALRHVSRRQQAQALLGLRAGSWSQRRLVRVSANGVFFNVIIRTDLQNLPFPKKVV